MKYRIKHNQTTGRTAMIRSTSWMFVALAVFAMTANTAQARPVECESGLNAIGYDRSYERNNAIIFDYFDRLGPTKLDRCNRYDGFANDVVDLMGRLDLSRTDGYSMCRLAGLMQGVTEALFDIEELCEIVCKEAGSAVGALEAGWLCDLAFVLGVPSALGWLPEPIVTMCQFDFDLACYAAWTDTAQNATDPLGVNPDTCYDAFHSEPGYEEYRDTTCELPPP
jgi:hypothetical protein